MPHVRRFVSETGYTVPAEYQVADPPPKKKQKPDDDVDKPNKPKKKTKSKEPTPPKPTNVYLRVFLCTVDAITTEAEAEQLLAPFAKDINEKYPYIYFPGKVERRQATIYPADTKEECNEWSEKVGWPLMWRGNVAAIPDTISEREQAQAVKYVDKLGEMYRHALEAYSTDKKQLPIVTIIVDPLNDRIIATGVDSREPRAPLAHSALIALEQAAKWRREAEAAALAKQAQETSKEPVAAPAINNIKNGELPVDYNEDIDGYLCRGFHVYMSHEPCAMCSMGLLHSRVTRLVYLHSKPHTGGIDYGSGQLCIHDQPSLNWQYEAWQWVGEKDANDVEALQEPALNV